MLKGSGVCWYEREIERTGGNIQCLLKPLPPWGMSLSKASHNIKIKINRVGLGWKRKANIYWIGRPSISLFCRLAETVSIFTAVSISKTYNDETCTSQCVLGELQMSGKHTWERMLIWHQVSTTLTLCPLDAWKGTEVILSNFSPISVTFGSRWHQENSTDELSCLPLASVWVLSIAILMHLKLSVFTDWFI